MYNKLCEALYYFYILSSFSANVIIIIIYVFLMQSEVSKLRFNTSGGGCGRPLVATRNPGSWYRDVEGCGIQCHNPLFTEDEHRQIHSLIAVFAAICMTTTLFAVVSVNPYHSDDNKCSAIL